MASDSVNLVAQLGGETIAYTPDGGAAVSFKAIVHRGKPGQAVQSGARPYTRKVLELEIPKDADDGVTSIKEGHDTVSVKFNIDDASATTFTVAKILSQDAGLVSMDGGLWRVECHA